MLNKIYKVVIWGHKLHSHTHSYVHNAYYKGFKSLGFDTYWFDNNDDVSNFNFENCIFLTEDQVHQKIPLNKSSFYILHHCKLQKYLDFGCNYINLCNYVYECREGLSYNYDHAKTIETISYYEYYDKINKGLYQPWATDLLPEEIKCEHFLNLDESKNDIYYIGSITQDNFNQIKSFVEGARRNNKNIKFLKNTSDEENKNFILNSFVSPDVRGESHLSSGYIPCRIFKNISYGVIPATNSKFIRDFFQENALPFAENPEDLIEVNKNFIKSKTNLDQSKWLINEIRQKHTYINRIDCLLKFI